MALVPETSGSQPSNLSCPTWNIACRRRWSRFKRILAIPAKKTGTRLVKHLTAQEMQSILDAPDPTVRDGIRDRAMLHLCFAGGLRVSELVGLRIEDMMLQPQASVLIQDRK